MMTSGRADSALLIDDDIELCSMLQEYLSRHGWRLSTRHNGQSGLAAALEGPYQIVLLDVMLPDLDGFEVLKLLRQQSKVNVLLLTARGEDVDRIVGLEMGADDYMPKPFNPRELVARMRAVVRRGGAAENGFATKKRAPGGFVVDAGARQIFMDEERLDLSDLEYQLLAKLIENPFRIVSREELVEQVLERPFRPLDRSIDMHLSRIRKKLEGLSSFNGEIRTIRSSGYMFVPARIE
jgi:two-component system response regulator CpxR